MSNEEMWAPVQVSEYLGVSVGGLANWRSQKVNISYYKVAGHVMYSAEEVRQFRLDCRVEINKSSPRPKVGAA